MGAGASTKLADAPDPVPRDVAERTLGVTLDAAEWAARADADGRVSQARLVQASYVYMYASGGRIPQTHGVGVGRSRCR